MPYNYPRHHSELTFSDYKPARNLKRAAREQRNIRKTVYDIAQADPTNIVSVRRGCCRYCHGENYEYQRTDWELDRDLTRHITGTRKGTIFNKMGGGGYVRTRDPNPDCPICLGEGEAYTRIEDFRKLSQQDRQLIAGVKLGKGGVVEEVKFHNKIDAVSIFAKIDGMITEKKVVKVIEMPEEELDQYFANNPITIDANEFRTINEESTTSNVVRELSPPEPAPAVETRVERLRRLKAEGVIG